MPLNFPRAGMKRMSCFMLAVLGMVMLASTASAQIYTPPINFSPQIGARIVQPQLDAQRRRSGSQSDETFESDDEQASPQVSLVYTPSKARTRANLQNFINKSRNADPAGAADLEKLIASTDVVGEISGNLRDMGLNPNNVADAFAVYWINAWSVSSGDLSSTSLQTAKAVAAQAALGLEQSPEFAAATNAQKQELAEAMMLQGALIASMADQATGNANQLKALGDAVRKGASASGLILDQMTLTEDGFVPAKGRKRADASDANLGDEQALASNDNGEGKSEPTNYALIAAAAGAGLGGVFLLGKAMGRKG